MSVNEVYEFTGQGRLSQVIERTTRSIPVPLDGQVVIAIRAVALNPVEEQFAQSSGRLRRFMGAIPPDVPAIPCSDFSGVIHATGKHTEFEVGEEVYGMKFSFEGNGTLQNYLCVDPSSIPLIRKPPNLSFVQAAALPLVYLTAYTALVQYGKLPFDPVEQDKGKYTVLVLGGSSGTGTVAVQLAKKMGLRVVATCSGKNVDLVKKLGADEVIDYRTEDLVRVALKSPCAPYAVVLDCVGGKDLIPHMEQLILHDSRAPHLGIYVTIVGDKTSRDSMGGGITNYYYPYQAIRTVQGTLTDYLPTWLPLRGWMVGRRYACIVLAPKKEYLETVPAFLASGHEAIVDSTFKFEEAKKAFEKLESGRAVGKVVVKMN